MASAEILIKTLDAIDRAFTATENRIKALQAKNERLTIENEQQQNLIESLQYDIEALKAK